MDTWIDLARGPLFRISLVICVLGLVYRIMIAILQIAVSWRQAGDRKLPAGSVVKATIEWLFPHRLLRKKPLYSTASFLFHVGMVLIPLFLLGHVSLLQGYLPAAWPVLNHVAADTLTLVACIALAGLVIGRLASRTSRALSKPQDVMVLLVLFFIMLCGFMAAHPAYSLLGARGMLLTHILLGNLVLILVPTTKIAHCVLYPFTQLIFELGWHFPAATGRHVATALSKENEPV